MGFLDNSTNNIIIDAVLTNKGRSALANNNGSFKIAFFSLADDEVDYSIIQQYGRTVGKEKMDASCTGGGAGYWVFRCGEASFGVETPGGS